MNPSVKHAVHIVNMMKAFELLKPESWEVKFIFENFLDL